MNRCWITFRRSLIYLHGHWLVFHEHSHWEHARPYTSHHFAIINIFAADAVYLFCQYVVGWFATLSCSPYSKQSQMFVLRQVASHGDITGHILSTAFVLCGVDINLQYNNLVVCLHPMKNNASFRIITSSINIIYVCQSHVHRLCSSLHYILRH